MKFTAYLWFWDILCPRSWAYPVFFGLGPLPVRHPSPPAQTPHDDNELPVNGVVGRAL